MKLSRAIDAKAVRAPAESAAGPRILESDAEKRNDRSVRSPQVKEGIGERGRTAERGLWHAHATPGRHSMPPTLHSMHAVSLYLLFKYVSILVYTCIMIRSVMYV